MIGGWKFVERKNKRVDGSIYKEERNIIIGMEHNMAKKELKKRDRDVQKQIEGSRLRETRIKIIRICG